MAATTAIQKLLDRDELDAFFGILVAQQRLIAAVDSATQDRLKLSFGAVELLLRLNEAPTPPRVSELADSVLLSRTRVSRLIASLEDRDLLTRLEHGADGRSSRLALTATGKQAAAEALEVLATAVRTTLIDRLDKQDIRALASLWRKSEMIEACDPPD